LSSPTLHGRTQLAKPQAPSNTFGSYPEANIVNSSWVTVDYYEPDGPAAPYPSYQFDFPTAPTIDLGVAYDIILVPEIFNGRLCYGHVSTSKAVTGPGSIVSVYEKPGPTANWTAATGKYLAMAVGYMRTNATTPVDISSTANKFSCASM
jgi:hypothetical protein